MSSAGTWCSASSSSSSSCSCRKGWCRARCGCGAGRAAMRAPARRARQRQRPRGRAPERAMTALARHAACSKSFGGLRVTTRRRSRGRARRAAADHRPQRRRQDHAVQPDHRRDRARRRLDRLFGRDITRVPQPQARASRPRPHLSDHHAVRPRHDPAQRHAGAARPVAAALEPVRRPRPPART